MLAQGGRVGRERVLRLRGPHQARRGLGNGGCRRREPARGRVDGRSRLARQAADAGKAAKQARGLTAGAVAAIRGSLSGSLADSASAALTMAIVSTLADAGLRRSEAAALAWADVQADADGSGRIAIPMSLT